MLSYRRGDSDEIYGRIYDSLRLNFGVGAVSPSGASIPSSPGTPAFISHSLERCAILVVLVGPRWFELSAQHRSWIDDPHDPTRIEITMALQQHIPTLHVLSQGMIALAPQQLPPDLLQLMAEPGIVVRDDPDYPADLQKLIQRLQEWAPILPPEVREGPKLAGRPALRAALSHLGVMFVLFLLVVAVALGVGLPLGFVSVGSAAQWRAPQQQQSAYSIGVMSTLLLIYTVTLFLAGRAASLRTGQMVTGNYAGLAASLITGCTVCPLLILAAIVILNSSGNTPVAILAQVLIFALILALALVGFLANLLLGTLLGSLGGVLGSWQRRRMSSQLQSTPAAIQHASSSRASLD
jgi:hypothetical protein